MSPGRVYPMIALLCAVAVASVYLRAEQTRCAARTLAIETELIRQRRELWRVQTAVARLRTPGHIRDRMAWFHTDLIPPGNAGLHGNETRLALSARAYGVDSGVSR